MSEVIEDLRLRERERTRAARRPRPQPIRDAILRFMTGPRSAGDIAEHIERPVPTTTGHLRAMIRLGLVRRIGFGTYAPGTYNGPKVGLPQRRSESSSALRTQLVALLHERSSVQGLHLTTGSSEEMVRRALRDLWLSGLVAGNEGDGFSLVRWKQKGT
jgi:hypothetical protein